MKIEDLFNKNEYGHLVAKKELIESVYLFKKGDGIDDNQLNTLIFFYSYLEVMLKTLGSNYYLATSNIRRCLNTLESFKQSRLNDI